MELNGRRIVVVGAARGMGASAVAAYTSAGAHVVTMDVIDDAGRAAADEVNGRGAGTAHYLHCDISSRPEVEAAFTEAVTHLGGLDVVVTTAAVERKSPAEVIPDEEWDSLFAINARGTFLTNQAAFPHLRDGGGRIINFASGAGINGMKGAATYSATKGAVLAWTRTIAREWARFGITANAIAPAIWTPMFEEHRSRLTMTELEALDARHAERIPLGGRLGDPDLDMAPVLVFLAGDGSRFITGQTLCVDGGMVMLS